MLSTLIKVFTGIKGYLIIAALIASAVLAVYLYGRSDGKSSVKIEAAEDQAEVVKKIAITEVKAAQDAAKKQQETRQVTKNVKDDITKLDDHVVFQRLRDEWTRD